MSNITRLSLKKILLVSGGLFLLLVIYFIGSRVSKADEIQVDVSVIPENAQVYIDGAKSDNRQIYLTPGKHIFEAKVSGYNDDKIEANIDNESNKTIELIPAPASEQANSYLDANPAIQRKREEIGGRRSEQLGESMAQETPILPFLPVDNLEEFFSIDYGASQKRENGTVLIISNSSPEGRSNAFKWMRERGQDPTGLEIQFEDFVNPLTGASGQNVQ